MQVAIELMERGLLPDCLVRMGIQRQCKERLKLEAARIGGVDSVTAMRLFAANGLADGPVAPEAVAEARRVLDTPAAFDTHVLGPRRKRSCCFWPAGARTLEEAEQAALQQICERAGLVDGQRVLDIASGCGALSLWIAEKFPRSSVTAVADSAAQRTFIQTKAKERGVRNLRVVVTRINGLEPSVQFDRVMALEVFERVSNYEELLRRMSRWLLPDGRAFVQMVCHRTFAYKFETQGHSNWIGRHFFANGVMPSERLLECFCDDLEVEQRWRWNGEHYARTALVWLQNLDDNKDRIYRQFGAVYGARHASRWLQRWRIFYVACAEMFRTNQGEEWFVSQMLLRHSTLQHPLLRNST